MSQDKQLTDLTELTTPADGDYVYVVDVSDTTDDAAGSSRKVQLANARGWPQTSAESAAAIVPTNLEYAPGNVLRYGTNTTPGTTDMTTAIQAAIDGLGSTGGEVFIPAGTYYITSAITVNKASVVIRGEGSSGWNSGGVTRVETDQAIVVFDLQSGAGQKGTQIRDLTINDTSGAGTALGAIKAAGQWFCLFENLSINDFTLGYAFSFDGTSAMALNSIVRCQGRQNKFGLKVTGTVASTYIAPSTYFSNSSPISGGVGIEIQDGWVFGGVDSYETGVKLVGDECLVSGRFEGNTTHCQIAGSATLGRRNIISGARFIGGGGTASIQIDNSSKVFDNVIINNTYASPSVGILDNSVSPQNNYIFEPQQNLIDMRRHTAGTVLHSITNSRNVATGDNAEYAANAANGAIQAVLRAATGSPNTVDVGSTTNQDVRLIRNDSTVATIKSGGILTTNVTENVSTANVITAAESGTTFYLNSATGFASTLPSPSAGLKFTFIVRTVPTSGNHTVVTTSGSNLMYGTYLDIVGELVYFSAQDTLNFVASTTVVGDRLELESDGTNWYCKAFSGADGGITTSAT